MNNKKNYKKGYKNEIIQLIYLCGLVPYRSLRLLADHPQLYQRAVKDLTEEKILTDDKKGGERNIRLQDRRKKKEEYEPYIPSEYIEYYEEETRLVLRRLGENDYTSAKKEIRNSDTKVMMYAAGIDISPDKKDLETEMIEKDDCGYYGSTEFKSVIGYQATVTNESRNKKEISQKILNSRVNGLLISPGGTYAVYNIGKELIEWRRKGELKMASSISALMRSISAEKYSVTTKKECIIIAQTHTQYIHICNNTNEKRPYKINHINIDYTYDRVYAVPDNRDGVKLLAIMKRRNWKEIILDSILTKEERRNALNTNIDCDGYDSETELSKLIFCIPDLVKLKNFVKRALIEDDRDKFKVYCFTNQLPLITGFASNSVQITCVEFDKYIERYF